MNCIEIKRLWSDECMIELEFSAKSLNIQSQLNFYVTEDELIELSEKLIRFPASNKDIIEWEVGSKDKNSYAYFRFKTFIFNMQVHVAIEIEMNNKLEQPYLLYSHFYIITEIASINEFGKKIVNLNSEDGTSIEGIVYRI